MMADSIVGLLAPHRCIGCDRSGDILCKECVELFLEDVPPRCAGCKQLSDSFKTCRSCKSWLQLAKVHVITYYDGIGERLIHEMKFESKRAACKTIATAMARELPINEYDVVCPIPTAPKRVRERGFDHAVEIAKRLSKLTEIPCIKPLLRVTNSRQVGATRTERMKQMESAFSLRRSELEGKNILLVDDVFTTGATLVSASRILRDAGAKSVSAIVFCQK